MRIVATAPRQSDAAIVLARNALEHAALERRTASELAALAPPVALRRDWARIVAYRRTLAAELVTLAHTLGAGRSPKVNGLLTAKAAAHKAMSQLAARDRFIACAKVGSA